MHVFFFQNSVCGLRVIVISATTADKYDVYKKERFKQNKGKK